MPTIVMRCPICGYISIDEIDFHHCPVCKSPVELFKPDTTLEARGNWDTKSILQIMETARTGHYALEGKGTTRSFLNLDDLVFLPAQIAQTPLLESEEVKCKVILGKSAIKPIIANTPILNAGMSFGALSREAKMALAKGSAMVGGVANTGEGGMLDEEKQLSDKITLQYSTGRFGISDDRLKMADMIEIKISQGAKPGMGGKLPGAKVTDVIALIRQIKPGQTATSPARHPDISSANELSDKIGQLREMTEGKPIALKMVGGHIQKDLTAVFDQPHIPDVLVIDGGEGGTGAAPIFTKDHVGLPLVYALTGAAQFLQQNNLRDQITLIATGGLRHGVDVAKAIALGADAVYMGGALKIALGCMYIRDCHKGTCPFGIATQNPMLRTRLNVDEKATRVANFIRASTNEIKAIARICGKSDIHEINKNDLAALTSEMARITGVNLA
ncbi:MAG: alpha-hydroxy-acid oxidizing protein [Deltaproteobacteria bacterium]|nr:alpha-hydroxy-acid oxidizing protein [Deltaproteobacteria bacterium]MBW1848701.1 alpha-hydroxy-acid oxidizing protein [Deltaproteobacteria bacterium]